MCALVDVNTFLAVNVELKPGIARTDCLLPDGLAVVLAVAIVSKTRIFELAITAIFRKNITVFTVTLKAVLV